MAATKLERSTAAKLRAQETRAKKLHVIAERRAHAAKMSKTDFIAAIVKGDYLPITAEDIDNEPTPE
ncbi:MAG TPA: hypothetical protein VHS31_10725 [Tepidisphaeraceae bacterium]|nr:hypothetical protein [Tepidisphaeraceae bacterium]